MKRIFGREEGEGDGSIVQHSKRPRPMLSALRGVMGAQCIQTYLPKLEPFVRRVVQEEVEKALYRFLHSAPRAPIDRIQGRASRRYRLLFENSLPHMLFTGNRIESKGEVSVEIVMTDTANSSKTLTSGPFSSVRVEILVLDGDFGCDSQEEWTEKEFGDSIVREREGKRPLLTGEVVLTLYNGVGYLGDISFTDNSSWIRSRKFRLGARLHQSRCTEVQEAISEAFLVKDHRGESYRKHHPPSLGDDVWRLEKIGKDGAFHRRLSENGINTVQDFLKNFVMDRERLRSLLGNGMSNKVWEATIEHAKECVLDEKLYSYCRGQEVVLLFNSIFQLVGAMFGDKYHPFDDLTPVQKVAVDKLKLVAYKNHDHIIELNLPRIDTLPGPSQLPEFHAPHQDESATQLGFHHLHSHHSELQDSLQPRDHFTGLDFRPDHCFGPSEVNSFKMRNFLGTQFVDMNASDHIYNTGAIPASTMPCAMYQYTKRVRELG